MNDQPGRDTVRIVDPMADPAPLPEVVVPQFTENGRTVTCVISNPADAQQTLYGTVTRPDGRLVGTYYPADRIRGQHWRVVTADGTHYNAESEPRAVAWLTSAAR